MAGLEKVCSISDVPAGQAKAFEVNGKRIALFNVGGKFYCIDALCTHEEGPLEEGQVDGFQVECPWHGSKFDLRTGKVTNAPARKDVSTYAVKTQGNDVLVKV